MAEGALESARRAHPLISIVVPCFNEEQSIAALHGELTRVLATRSGVDCEFVFVDDGSTDGTARVLGDLVHADPRVTVVTLSRNFGHQPAVGAGLARASGDAVIVCDADLQDPPEIMPEMIDRWREGADVVYAVRSSRQGSAWRRAAYHLFYRILSSVSELDIPADCGDFGLMDRRVVDAINGLPERNRFVRGLRAWVGYEQTALAYHRPARLLGKSKYSFGRLLRLALDGIFDFSTKPLTLIFVLGLVSSVLSLAGFAFFLAHRVIGFKVLGHTPEEVPGITSVVLAVFFFGGVQLLATGVLGEYVGRIYREVKRRPSFIVKAVNGRQVGRDVGVPRRSALAGE
ncbi:MAG: glycosyltransferase family 2 protein [Xanthobacteraceae bacterium]